MIRDVLLLMNVGQRVSTCDVLTEDVLAEENG